MIGPSTEIIIERWRKGRFPLKKSVSDRLDNVIWLATKDAAKYMETTHYTTFAYGERQMNSLLAPAFSMCSSAMILEYPSIRKIGSRNHFARADYFCHCDKGRSTEHRMFVELKSSWQRVPVHDGFNKSNVELYGKACKQICGLINEFRGDNREFYSKFPIIRVCMLTLALYSVGNEVVEWDEKELLRQAESQFSYKGMRPNLMGVWKTPAELRDDMEPEWKEDNYKLQGLMYICHIMEPYHV